MLDSVYPMTIRLIQKSHFWRENVTILIYRFISLPDRDVM